MAVYQWSRLHLSGPGLEQTFYQSNDLAAARLAAKGLVFLTVDANGQPAARDRKLIRSHVMRGKNTRTRGLPGRMKSRGQTIAMESERSQHASGGNNHSEESPQAQARHESLNSTVHALARIGHQGMIPRAANVFTFIKFPEDISSTSRTLLCTCTTIQELNKQLADPTTALTDSTTTVVMGMALMAEGFGDVESAHLHITGLKQIVALRGGMKSFANRPQLESKLRRQVFALACQVQPIMIWSTLLTMNARRAGLVYHICTGASPAFHQDAASFDSAFDCSPELTNLKPSDTSCFSRSRSVARALERRLYIIWKDVQGLSQLINDSHESGQKIREMSLEDLMTSVQSRLLMLTYTDSNSLPELLRLSLLAFLTTVFWSFPGIKFEYPHLVHQLRQACQAYTPATAGESYLFAWALMVGATSVFHDLDHTWLRKRLRPLIPENLGTTWSEVQNSLRQVMWIESIHDGPGIEILNICLGEPGDGSIDARGNTVLPVLDLEQSEEAFHT
ncbi:uncharacterized protein VDAG_05820 [Verticillium dahliae VdLs.17]|uniref:Transcription factor domain-containing protein n=1 Tax=Verticillium dahliae (strain VdLs.17 / ATCC MYA-4575 / FGSC 10137) TaxID=498257 RepID=G2X6N8_VERDV|nr:uncharacterized protein VDAG_05820 [Verticillium dahliae VdLs.17]EGY14656.1 hypothetical protein VDAG_05820 [Verticillium dahliae VdLs.17]